MQTYLRFFFFFGNGKRLSQGPHFSIHFPHELQCGLRRTIYYLQFYANRGLWDAIPPLRTTPDKHENYHQCVCVKTPSSTVNFLYTFNSIFEQGCVWKHLTTRWTFCTLSTRFLSRGPERVGGVSGQRRHPPPPGANVPAFFFFFGNGKKLSQGPHFSIHFPHELQCGLRRTIYYLQFYANRGLWDAIPPLRTTPDKHENYHQCVLLTLW